MSDKFAGFSHQTLDFLYNLSLNNEKPWFVAHKSEFEQFLYLPMKTLGQNVFEKVSSQFPNRNFIHKLSRIYRDARYLRVGDGPYRTSMWFSIEKPAEGEWMDKPVFWFDLSAENWSYGMGYGGAKATTMAQFRTRIDGNPQKFEQLVAFLDKQEEFVLDGEEYARKKEPPSVKTDPWYNKKSFSLIHKQIHDEELFSPNLADRIATGMLSLMPIYDWLNA